MCHARSAACSLLLLLAAPAALAQDAAETPPAPADTPSRSLEIRLLMSSELLGKRYLHAGAGSSISPTAIAFSVPVGMQARAAHEVALSRMLPTISADPEELQLSFAAIDSGLGNDWDGWYAWVEHALVLREPGGAEVARWRVRGEEAVAGFGGNALPIAFARAAEAAARRSEALLRNDPAVVAWLRDHRIELAPPATTASPTIREQEQRERPPAMGRPPIQLHVDAGAAILDQQEVRLVGHAGFEIYQLQVHAAFESWRVGVASGRDATVRGAGVDVAWVLRLAPAVEARLGGGIRRLGAVGVLDGFHELSGDVTASTYFVALQSGAVVSSSLGIALRLGLELRRYVGATVQLAGHDLQLAETAVGFFLGFDLPLVGSAGSGR